MARIVVMEDETDEGMMFCQLLEKAGHAVHLFDSTQAALDYLEANGADIVITDIFVRNHGEIVPDGGQRLILTLRQLKRIDSSALPIIAISGGILFRESEGLNALQVARDLGADAFFEKPVPIDELLLAIDELLRPGERKPVRLIYGVIE